MISLTGATGLLGSRLLFDLLSSGEEKIRALKRESGNIETVRKIFSYYTDKPDDLFKRIEWIDFDILDIDSVTESLKGTSKLYHVAAIVSFSPKDRVKMIKDNVLGAENIVNACLELNIEKLCHVSSTSAIGNAPEGEFSDEKLVWRPDKMNTAYSISKFHSEMEVWRGIEEGLKAVIVNPSIILGPGFWDKGSSLMFNTVYKGLRFYTEGVSGFVSLKDVSDCMIKLMDSDIYGERFIISAENLSYKEVLDNIARSLNVKPPSIEAGPVLTRMAVFADSLRSIFTGKRIISKEAAFSSIKKVYFSNEKIKKAIGKEFESINETIKFTGERFLKDKNSNG